MAPPGHPSPVGHVEGGIIAGVFAVERPGVGVVAKIDGPGEVVVQLDAIDAAALHDFANQADQALAHPWMGGIEPHHRLAMHAHAAGAIAGLQDPVGVLLHHGGIGRLHQSVLKPRNHLHAAPMGRCRHAANRIQGPGSAAVALGLRLGQGRLDGGKGGAVEGGSPAPHVGVEGVEAGFGELADGLINPGVVVVERARAVGEPHANPPGLAPGSGTTQQAGHAQGGGAKGGQQPLSHQPLCSRQCHGFAGD